MCEQNECMIDPNLIETINQGNYLWTASNYTEFWGRKLSDGILYRLGTLEPERAVRTSLFIKRLHLVVDKYSRTIKYPSVLITSLNVSLKHV